VEVALFEATMNVLPGKRRQVKEVGECDDITAVDRASFGNLFDRIQFASLLLDG